MVGCSRTGNDISWANKNLNTDGWKKLNPSELSKNIADKNGKVEGWFRFKFKLDTGFVNFPLGIKRGCWAATDIYVDGNHFYSFGNTGKNGNYKEFNPIDKPAQSLDIRLNEEHLLAVHFVDYLSPLPPTNLKSNFGGFGFELKGLHYLIMLNGPKFNSELLALSGERMLYRSMWVSVTALLTLLFWLLVFQNPAETKTLRLIAIYTSCSALANLCRFFFSSPDVSFLTYAVSSILFNFFTWMVIMFTFIVVIAVLKFKLSRVAWSIFISFFVLGSATAFVFSFFQTFLYSVASVVSLIYVYIIVASWKKIKRGTVGFSDWIVIIGFVWLSLLVLQI